VAVCGFVAGAMAQWLHPESRRMAPSRACASACASRAPGAESVKVQDAKLAADPNAALQKGGVFGAKRKHLAEWKGSKNQDDCALGGTIGGAPALRCPPCPGVLARSAASSAPPPQRHTPQPHSRRATRSRNPRLAKKRGPITRPELRRASWFGCRRSWAARALVQWLRFEWQRAG
jgi:hypothetical protein